MDTKKLIIALVLVAVLGAGAHLYLKKVGDKRDYKWDAPASEQVAEDDSASEEDSEDDETVPPSASNDIVAPTSPTPVPPSPANTITSPEPEESIDDLLGGLGDEDEDYDDGDLDTSFNSNLDDAI